MQKRALMMCSVLLLIAFITLAVRLIVKPQRPLTVAVAFSGYSNDVSDVRLALLSVTNNSDVRIRRWGIYHVQVQGDTQRGPLFHGRNKFLDTGQSITVALPVYTNGAAWRVGLHCSRDGWRRSFSDFSGTLPPSLGRFVPRRLRGTPVELAWSDWIGDDPAAHVRP